ncbi:hypothetical protein [Streptomyces sp. B1I3]|uniref:hypothetical protein n=1 Tax=Streptomyces sp. B1I3 TaxID=3042264 RepID=UPI00277D63AE|nr:hypothetical protein [Streptomyces sp. B1I3]MDQ0794444.1 Flp pilus assembly pilin Flp [Streptomyces sp. B1I3]
MPDRLRTAFGHPLPERASTLMRERRPSSPDSSSPGSSSPGSSGSGAPDSSSDGAPSRDSSSDGAPSRDSSSAPSDDNPFAAPPEDRPDRPWQPRHPSPGPGNHGGDGGSGDDGDGPSDGRPVWGSRWSDQQPGRQDGGFGSRPGNTGGAGGQGGPEGKPGGLRWDPADPAQRRARYALLGGMWAFFFALFDFPEIALLLGALAVYWSISALRAGPHSTPAPVSGSTGIPDGASGDAPDRAPAPVPPAAAPGTPRSGGRQQTTAAVSGLVTALLALAIVATGYTVQLVYRDYYTCVNDALTKTGALACNDRLPDPLEPFFGVKK